MLQKVIKIGNSYGATFPREFVVRNKIKAGSKIESTGSNGSITFSTKVSKPVTHETISDEEFFGLVREIDLKYKDALDELANLP